MVDVRCNSILSSFCFFFLLLFFTVGDETEERLDHTHSSPGGNTVPPTDNSNKNVCLNNANKVTNDKSAANFTWVQQQQAQSTPNNGEPSSVTSADKKVSFLSPLNSSKVLILILLFLKNCLGLEMGNKICQ